MELKTFERNQVLPLMKPFSEDRSVLIMDNDSTHHSEVIVISNRYVKRKR